MSSTTENTSKPLTKAQVEAFYGDAEQRRLHTQHVLAIAAFSNKLLLFPGAQDLAARPNLRILDNAGADGFWLTQLQKQLQHPESAKLVSADIAPQPDKTAEGLELVKHDMTEEWPAEWDATFDLVHQRACVAFLPSWDAAVTATRRLLRLLQPGGYIQLIDGAPPQGPLSDDDPPRVRFFKLIIRATNLLNLAQTVDPPIATRLPQLLAEAAAAEGIELEDEGEIRSSGKWGKCADSEELAQLGIDAVDTMMKNIEGMWEKKPEARTVETAEWEKLRAEVVREVRETGFEMPIQAAWGRRKA